MHCEFGERGREVMSERERPCGGALATMQLNRTWMRYLVNEGVGDTERRFREDNIKKERKK